MEPDGGGCVDAVGTGQLLQDDLAGTSDQAGPEQRQNVAERASMDGSIENGGSGAFPCVMLDQFEQAGPRRRADARGGSGKHASTAGVGRCRMPEAGGDLIAEPRLVLRGFHI